MAQHSIPRTPLHMCALTLAPHRAPVCCPDGHVFEAGTVRQLLRRTHVHPLTGAPLDVSQLQVLVFTPDPAHPSRYVCPVLRRPLGPADRVVAVPPTGHVMLAQALSPLPQGLLRNPLDGASLSSAQLLVLFDPLRHTVFRLPDPLPSALPPIHSLVLPPLRPPGRSSSPPSSPSTTPSMSVTPVGQNKRTPTSPLHPPTANSKRPRACAPAMGTAAAASAVVMPVDRKPVYRLVRKGRKGKGYVRVVTNLGHLNIELHCDKAPLACDNFLQLSHLRYYDSLRWHRTIPGLLVQTGDPTGTGDGGESVWRTPFKHEFRTSLTHNAEGVVSFASSGTNCSNNSQWFITLSPAPQFDGVHTVFGNVVGGLAVLRQIDAEAAQGHPLTVERIEVISNPFHVAEQKLGAQSKTELRPPPHEQPRSLNFLPPSAFSAPDPAPP